MGFFANNFLFFWGSVSLLTAVFYVWMMRRYLAAWEKSPEWELPAHYTPQTFISVIIPARNEADQIRDCLDSIMEQQYPKELFEVIVVDDHSTDETEAIVSSLAKDGVRLIKLADHLNHRSINSYKKAAIEAGIVEATGELIVSTDADCKAPLNWLRFLASYYEISGKAFVAAPVQFEGEQNTFERFQSLDFIGMMLITGGAIQDKLFHMCNGANLAYSKALFTAVGGFEGVDQLASGDDMFLMQKVAAQFPENIGFLKSREVAVKTSAKPTWRSFLQQRIRWASKTGSYQEKRMILYLGMVFLFCCSLVVNLLLIPFWGSIPLSFLIFQLTLKAVADYQLLKEATRYFGRTDLLKVFWPAQLWHIVYIVAVGTLANLRKQYQWKGRRVR